MTTGEPEPPHLAPPPDLPSYMIVPTPDRPDPPPPPEPVLADAEPRADVDGDTETRTISVPRHRHRASDSRAGDLPATADRSLTALLAAVVVAVLVLAGGILIWLTHNPFRSSSTAQAPATQQTLLALLTDTHQHVLAGAVLAVGPTGGVSVMVPSALVLDLPGGAQTSLADVLSNSADPPAALMARDLGLPVDGSWTLTTVGLSDLVDVVGGITVARGAAAGVAGAVNQPPIPGAQAAALASALAPGEPENDRLARFSTVLIGTIARLAGDQAGLSGQLAQAGSGSSSTLQAPQLAQTLLALHRLAVLGTLQSSLLPLRTVTTADGGTQFAIDPVAARGVISRQVSGPGLPLDAGTVRVLVEDGVGVPGLVEAAGRALAAQGLESVGTHNAGSFGQARTVVFLASPSAAERARGLRVAAALGLGAASLRVNAARIQDGQDVNAEVVVVLGADFHAPATAAP